MAADISAAEQASIVSDFERGRCHILFQLSLKLTHWQQQPWASYALASMDASVALQAVQNVLASRNHHHQITRLQQPCIRSELEAFQADPSKFWESSDTEYLLNIRQVFASMRLAFSAERRIEGKQATSKKGISHAPHHSTPYVSLLHRLPDLEAALRCDHDFLMRFALQLSKVKSGRAAVRLLGLHHHPECLAARHGRDPVYTKIIYHADSYSKYTVNTSDFLTKNFSPREHPDLQKSSGLEAIQHNMAILHLRKAWADVEDPNAFFSLPMQAGVFRTLKSLLAPLQASGPSPSFFEEGAESREPSREAGAADEAPAITISATGEVCFHGCLDLWAGRAEPGPDAGRLQDHMFFKVFKADSLKRAHRAHAEDEIDLKDVLAVTLHSASSADVEKRIVEVCTSAVSLQTLRSDEVVVTLNPQSLPFEILKRVVAWKAIGSENESDTSSLSLTLSFEYLHTLPKEARRVLPQILQKVRSTSYVGGFRHGKQSQHFVNALFRLKHDGLLSGPPWKFTDKGASCVQTCVPLKYNQPLLKRADGSLKPEDMSGYELMVELEASGWKHELVSRKERLRVRESPYTADKPKIWYTVTSATTVCVEYLLALLLAPNHGKPVPHFRAASEYRELLGWANPSKSKSRASKQKPLNIIPEDDAMMHDLVPESPAPVQAQDVGDREPANPEHHEHQSDQACAVSRASSSGSSSDSDDSDSGSSSSSSSDSDSAGHGSSGGSSSSSSSGDKARPATGKHGSRKARAGEYWGVFRFTFFNRKEGGTGWQCTCTHAKHNLSTALCTKSRSNRFEGGDDAALRMLKQWAISGRAAKTKKEHQDKWQAVLHAYHDSTLMSDAELEAQRIDSWEAVAAENIEAASSSTAKAKAKAPATRVSASSSAAASSKRRRLRLD